MTRPDRPIRARSRPLRLGTQTNVVTDRLGSVRREAKDFFPYGQERTVTVGETEKYATYMHDGRTDLAYADQRYYATGVGRFMTADPAGDGLNWYAYAGGDPVNHGDPSGLGCKPMFPNSYNPDGPCGPGFLWSGTYEGPINVPGNGDQVSPELSWALSMVGFADSQYQAGTSNGCADLFNVDPTPFYTANSGIANAAIALRAMTTQGASPGSGAFPSIIPLAGPRTPEERGEDLIVTHATVMTNYELVPYRHVFGTVVAQTNLV
jgi:RHS repeat-associated protein